MFKLRLWWRRLFFGHEERTMPIETLALRKGYCRVLEEERAFTHALFEVLLRGDYPRHQILSRLQKNHTPEFAKAVENVIAGILEGSELPPLAPLPVIDFPLTYEGGNREEKNRDSISSRPGTPL